MTNIRLVGKVTAWAVVGVLGIAGIAGAAESVGQSQRTAASTSPAANSPGAHHGRGGELRGLRRAEYGELVYRGKDGKDVFLDVQRGAISGVSPTGFTVTSADGHAQSYLVSSATRIRTGGQTQAAITDIPAGTQVFVVAVRSGDTRTARVVTVLRHHKDKAGTPSATT